MEDEMLDLLAVMFDAYENGPACYEVPEECGGYIGNAVLLDDATFHRVADILNARRPRNGLSPNVTVRGAPLTKAKRSHRTLIKN